MVLAGEDDVFHASLLRELGDRLGVELVGMEAGGEFLVFRDRNAGHPRIHDPLADAVVGLVLVFVGEIGIEPPMDEHRVVALIKQLAAFGILRAEFDDGFAPHFIHFFGPDRRRETDRGQRQQAGLSEDVRLFNGHVVE